MDGKYIPNYIEFGVEMADGKEIAIIPNFYLHDHKWLMGEKGLQLTLEQCEDFFRHCAGKIGLSDMTVVSDGEWSVVKDYQEMYLTH